jgi:chloramphenicol O-acetyltransferase
VDVSKFYYVLAEKDQSFNSFMRFQRFMFDNYKLINTIKEESDREAFAYHFHKIPEYTFNIFSKLEYSLLNNIATADLAISNVGKSLKRYKEGAND